MIKKLTINNYRNIEKVEIDLDKSNLIIQHNGYGKTNFLEAIYYSIFRNSFRNLQNYAELIGPFKKFTKLDMQLDQDYINFIISNDKSLTKKIFLNDKQKATKKFLKALPIILFAPNSVDLVNGSPQIRRKDLDDFLSTNSSEYFSNITTYKKLIKNKNALLKMIRDGKSTKSELDYWNKKIAKHADYIYKSRQNFFTEIKSYIKDLSKNIYHDLKDLEIKYQPNQDFGDDYEIELIKKFTDNIQKEIIVGKTLYGVHKDDFSFLFKDSISSTVRELRFSGSRGQQRIGSFLYKMGQLFTLKNNTEEDIVLLIDDLMSELDQEHRNNLAEFLNKIPHQKIITGADIKEIPKVMIENSKLIEW